MAGPWARGELPSAQATAMDGRLKALVYDAQSLGALAPALRRRTGDVPGLFVAEADAPGAAFLSAANAIAKAAGKKPVDVPTPEEVRASHKKKG